MALYKIGLLVKCTAFSLRSIIYKYKNVRRNRIDFQHGHPPPTVSTRHVNLILLTSQLRPAQNKAKSRGVYPFLTIFSAS